MECNKLVKDRIPEIIAADGKKAITRILGGREYLTCLEKKRDEETANYHKNKELEVFADILEVVYALCCH